jgi:uncharacterized protein YceK
MKKLFSVMSLVGIALLLSGCSTVIMRANPENRGQLNYYPATRYDAFTIGTGGGMYSRGDCDNGVGPVVGWLMVVPLHIVDLPISLVTDTVMLPFDMRRKAKKTKEGPGAPQNVGADAPTPPQH